MRTAYIISGTAHAAILIWCVWWIAANPLRAPTAEALPVDVVNISDLTQATAGAKTAPKAETPKPLVEQTGETKPVEDPTAKLDKKEVKAVRDTAPPPEAKPTEAKPDQKKAEVKPDPIAEALAKEQTKKPEPKKAEVKPPAPPKKPTPPAPKFDPKQVEALLDKRNATRLAAAGETINTTASAGLPHAAAAQMSLSELDALRRRLHELWAYHSDDPNEPIIVVTFQLKPDGTLAGRPEVTSTGGKAAARDSAIRAVYRGQPFNMLKPEHYEQWKDIEINFDPHDQSGY